MRTSTRPVGEKSFSPLSCADFLAGWLHGDDRTEFRMASSIRDPGMMGRLNLAVARLRLTARGSETGGVQSGEEDERLPARPGPGAASTLTARRPSRSTSIRTLVPIAGAPVMPGTTNIGPDGEISFDEGKVEVRGKRGVEPILRKDPAPERDDETISLREFYRKIPDEAAAIAFVEERRWAGHPICPHCDGDNVYRVASGKPMSHRCRDCGYFSVRIGTIMEDTNLPIITWLEAIHIIHTDRKGVSSIQMGKMLGVTQRTAWFLNHRIREAMKQEDMMVAGVVQVDETLIGGLERNRHAWQKEQDRKAGRTHWDRKYTVIAMRQDNGAVVAYPVETGNFAQFFRAVLNNVAPGSMVYTDGSSAYQGLPQFGYGHEWVNHAVGQYVDGEVTVNGVESFWALLKRGYKGTFHYISWEHLHRYCNEFAYRLNAGLGNGFGIIGGVVDRMFGERLTWQRLTGKLAA